MPGDGGDLSVRGIPSSLSMSSGRGVGQSRSSASCKSGLKEGGKCNCKKGPTKHTTNISTSRLSIATYADDVKPHVQAHHTSRVNTELIFTVTMAACV